MNSWVGAVILGLTERTISQKRFLSHGAKTRARAEIDFAHSPKLRRYFATL